MMVDQIQQLIDAYHAWLREKTRLREVNGWVEITTPFLDRHNDFLQVYATRENGRFLLTDDSYTITDLRLSGCELHTPKRQRLLETTLNGFGVGLDGDALVTHATERDFAVRKHNLVQAMLAVNDLFFLAPASVMSFFVEDVEEWLRLVEVRFVPKIKFTGRSGIDHVFNFVVPGFRDTPERIIQAVNRPNLESAKSLLFAWTDTLQARSEAARMYAFLNDTTAEPSVDVVDALEQYDVRAVRWSQREQVRAELAA